MAGPVAGLDLTVSTTSFGYPHPNSDARWLTELAIVATIVVRRRGDPHEGDFSLRGEV